MALPGAHPMRGIALMVGAGGAFALLDAVAKSLAATYPTPMIAWLRYLFHVLVMLAVLAPGRGFTLVRTRRPALQLLRGVCLGASSICFFNAIARMPLAEATAIIATGPILVTVAAVLWMGERAPRGSTLSLALSFLGVMCIVRPGGALFGWPAAMAVATAFFGTGYQLCTRRLTGIDDGVSTLFLGGVVATLVLALPVPWNWVTPHNGFDVVLFVFTGVIGAGGHLMLVRAFENAPAVVLAPFGYAHAVVSLPLGWLVFGNLPDRWALGGMMLIVVTGVWMAWRHHMRVDPIED